MARIVPILTDRLPSLNEALAAWRAAGEPDAAFADDLERIGAADRPPANPWAS
ncbi:MAG: hypothetical protein HY727_01495 [Candidatus Rokubacteria bacterium]|nr:hypothetical protein [Candidatus Rokubacteria bacterium]